MKLVMVKRSAAILVLTAVSACSSDLVRKDAKDTLTQLDIAESVARQRADAAAKQARLLREQEELRRQLNERNQRQTISGAGGLQIKALHEDGTEGRALHDLAAGLQVSEDLLAKRTVYYDYDSYAVKQDYQPMLEAHATLLNSYPEMQLEVEGNCDERGSREYNLALGQRRADAVKRVLTLLGVSPTQIKTVSFGSEKPRVVGQAEADLAKNRRSDMAYPGMPAMEVTTRRN